MVTGCFMAIAMAGDISIFRSGGCMQNVPGPPWNMLQLPNQQQSALGNLPRLAVPVDGDIGECGSGHFDVAALALMRSANTSTFTVMECARSGSPGRSSGCRPRAPAALKTNSFTATVANRPCVYRVRAARHRPSPPGGDPTAKDVAVGVAIGGHGNDLRDQFFIGWGWR